jgi:hypothetical protein
MTRIRIVLLTVVACLISTTSSMAVVPYVDICGVISVNGLATPDVLVEAVRCSDDVVLAAQLTQPAPLFNYHLVYDEPDDGRPGGQFLGKFNPIPVYVRISYPGCPSLLVPCAETASGYEQTVDGKLFLNKDIDCPNPIGRIGDVVFCDQNGSGVQEDTEPGVPGITVKLTYTTTSGTVLTLSTNTDANGRYLFQGIPDGAAVKLETDSSSLPPDKLPGQCPPSYSTVVSPGNSFLDADFCIVPTPVVDADSDGLPDPWEQTYGLNPNDPTDAGLDSDDDGSSNLAEWNASTNPKDPLSKLAISSLEFSELNVGIRFKAQRWKSYQVERTQSLEEPVKWIPVDVAVALRSEADEIVVTDLRGSGRPTKFYRVVLVR